jgi:hypothetical protein
MSFAKGDKVRLSFTGSVQVIGEVIDVWGPNDTTTWGEHFDYSVEFPNGEIDDFRENELVAVSD